jgi:hypothetical protein
VTSATIKLFLPHGDAKALRTAEISNWTGKALAAPRTELDGLVAREECEKAGVYVLTGTNPSTNAPHAYIGEAEVIRDRLKQHKGKEFWVSAIVFVSKDENLTKAHVRYLESRLLAEAIQVGRFSIEQNQAGGSKLPESSTTACPRIRPSHTDHEGSRNGPAGEPTHLPHQGCGSSGTAHS